MDYGKSKPAEVADDGARRRCRWCGQNRHPRFFDRSSEGVDDVCRACRKKDYIARQKTWHKKFKKPSGLAEGGMKYCSRCGDHLSVEDFHKCSSKPDGLNSTCKICAAEAKRSRGRG